MIPELEALDVESALYKTVQCKRFGIRISNFSNVLGTIILEGTMFYDSNKNYRSNNSFVKFMENNEISRHVLVFILQNPNPSVVYNDFGASDEERERHMDELMGVYQKKGPYDAVIYGSGCPKFKFQRSKVFYIKMKKVLYGGESERLFVENVTIECSSTFQS